MKKLFTSRGAKLTITLGDFEMKNEIFQGPLFDSLEMDVPEHGALGKINEKLNEALSFHFLKREDGLIFQKKLTFHIENMEIEKERLLESVKKKLEENSYSLLQDVSEKSYLKYISQDRGDLHPEIIVSWMDFKDSAFLKLTIKKLVIE